MLKIILLFQERANFPPAAFSLFPYPSFHLVSLIPSPLHILAAPVVVPFPNLQAPLKQTIEKEKIHKARCDNSVKYNYLWKSLSW